MGFFSKSDKISKDDLKNIEKTANHVLELLRKRAGNNIEFDAESIKLISDAIDHLRGRLSAEQRENIAWMYGAFLGQAIIKSYSNGKNHWVDNGVDNFTIKIYTNKKQEVMASPFNRVLRHIDEGAESSIYAYFVGIGHFVENGIKA
jgi:hypothetical protein